MQHEPATGDEGETCARCGARHPESAPCDAPGRTLAYGTPWPAAAPPPPGDPLIGAQVGSFRIVRMLGRGGMGTVYLAEHPAIGSRVAIKFLHESMASDPEVVGRFYDEARAVNLIGHENIVGIFDLSLLPPNRYYIVMEYLEGETLSALLARGRPAPRTAIEILLQLCDALQAAHARGVVHRDLKPDNVFLVPRRGRSHFVKLVDFGIAKLRGAATGAGRTQAGLIVGTPEYMAPEQCEEAPVDARTDVYALGVIAFELATGQLPFRGSGLAQLLLAHLGEEPPRPSDVAAGVDPTFEAAILCALRKDPAARFQDTAALAAALRPVLEVEADRTRPAPATPSPTAAEPPAALAAEVHGAGPPRRCEVVELTRGGLFLREEGAPPPLRTRVRIGLAHPSLRARLEVAGEVVRHVAATEAAAWRTQPGFAVQLVDLAPGDRAAIAGLVAAVGAAGSPTPPAGAGRPRAPATEAPDPRERLEALEARPGGSPYALLALAPDAGFDDVRRVARALRAELEGIAERPAAADHPARARALLVRVEAAAQVLGVAAERLRHDAEHGNWRGVARCIAAGVPAALVASRREELLSRDPARRAEAERQLARARVARKLGNADAALAAWEAALAADPLDGAAHEAYAALRRELARVPGGR